MESNNQTYQILARRSIASNQYQAFADVASSEGLLGIAGLFLAAAESQAVHARAVFKALGVVCSTKQNLELVIGQDTGESGVNMTASNQFPETSNALKVHTAYAHQAEKQLSDLFVVARAALAEGLDLEEKDFHVCQGCGYVHMGDTPPAECPVCTASDHNFWAIDCQERSSSLAETEDPWVEG